MSKRKLPDSSSARLKKANAKAKESSFHALGENNPYRELLKTEADFLDDCEAAIIGASSAISRIKDESERNKLYEVQEAFLSFVDLQEQVFAKMLENEDPITWTAKLVEMKNAYTQMLLLLGKAHFSPEADEIFKNKVKELGRVPQDIHSYLSKPMQRIQRYHMLIEQILKSLNETSNERLKSLRNNFTQAHILHLSTAMESNIVYGILSSAEEYNKTIEKKGANKTNTLEKMLKDILRKHETGEYILSTEAVARLLQDYVKNPVFLKDIEQMINKQKREIELSLNPQDLELHQLDDAIRTTFKRRIEQVTQRDSLAAQANVLKTEISTLLGKRIPLSVTSREYEQLNSALEVIKKQYKELSDRVNEMTTQIDATDKQLFAHQENFHQRQQTRKEALRTKLISLKLEHKQLTLLQQDLTLAAHSPSLVETKTAPSPLRLKPS